MIVERFKFGTGRPKGRRGNERYSWSVVKVIT